MATHKMSGKPTRTTPGSIGDIYIDTDTGTKYKCTFAYSANGAGGEYSWKEIKKDDKTPVTAAAKTFIKPDPKPVAVEETVEPEVVETDTEEDVPVQPKRTNYNKHYNKQNRN